MEPEVSPKSRNKMILGSLQQAEVELELCLEQKSNETQLVMYTLTICHN